MGRTPSRVPVNEYDLPPGWAEATLGDVITGFEAGRNLRALGRPAATDEYGVLKISSVTWGSFRPDENKALLPGDAPRAHETVRENDLLITRANTRDLVGAVVLVERDYPRLMLPDKILRLCVMDEMERGFLLHALRTPNAREHFEHNATGTSDSMRNLSQPKIAATPIRIAPLSEQKHIATKVSSLLTEVSSARERLDRVKGLLKAFRQSVLAAAVSGELTKDWRANQVQTTRRDQREMLVLHRRLWEQRNARTSRARKYQEPFAPVIPPDADVPESWVWSSVSSLAFLDVGFAFPSSEFKDEGIRLLRGENVEPGSLRWAETKHWPKARLDEFRHLLVEPGEIILAMDRPIVSAGLKLARVKPSDVPALLVQRVMRFKMVTEADTQYLYICLMERRFREVLAHDGMTGSDLPHITGTGVAEFSIPLPPPEEQIEIVRKVETLLALADAIERRVRSGNALAEKLPQAILMKAFSGELAPHDPNEESAELLLDRLRKQKEVAMKKRKRSPRTAEASAPTEPSPVSADLAATAAMSKRGMTPDELFTRSGYKVDDPDDVARFYRALRDAIAKGSVREVRTSTGDPRIVAVP